MSASETMPGVRYAFVRRRGGFELWRWNGNHGVNLSSQSGAGYPATLELARAWARGDAFRQGVPYAEIPKRKREKRPPKLTEAERERQRIRTLDALATQDKDPARAAQTWINAGLGRVFHTHYRPDRARAHAEGAETCARNAIACLERWIVELQQTKPQRRLKLVGSAGDR